MNDLLDHIEALLADYQLHMVVEAWWRQQNRLGHRDDKARQLETTVVVAQGLYRGRVKNGVLDERHDLYCNIVLDAKNNLWQHRLRAYEVWQTGNFRVIR